MSRSFVVHHECCFALAVLRCLGLSLVIGVLRDGGLTTVAVNCPVALLATVVTSAVPLRISLLFLALTIVVALSFGIGLVGLRR